MSHLRPVEKMLKAEDPYFGQIHKCKKKIVMTPNLPYLDPKPENVTGSFYLINV